jgi:hypothetical protein
MVDFKKIIEDLRKTGEQDAVRPLTDQPLFLLYDKKNDSFRFLIKICSEEFRESLIPKWVGVGFDQQFRQNEKYIELFITNDNDNEDIFEMLISDIYNDQTEVESEQDAFNAFLNTLDNWDSFFKNKREGLSAGAQRGLYGELFFLLHHIFPNAETTSYALKSWRGHDRKHQDFELNNGNVEVKTTIQKEHKQISINNEKQLDPKGLKQLYLYVLSMKAVNADESTLPKLVHDINQYLEVSNEADKTKFKIFLTKAGYESIHEHKYLDVGYYVEDEGFYKIDDQEPFFPSVTSLPIGVGDIKYTIVLSACENWKVDIKESVLTLI